MPILGAHMSIAGGYYKAVEAAAEFQCDCVQVFTKNNNQWRAKPITQTEAERFQETLAETGVRHPLSHSSYLINLGSPDAALWRKSVDAFVVELERAEQLGIPYVVLHPGAHTTVSEEEGLENVIRALNEVHERTSGAANCLLETTAGQGTCLGWRFEQLAAIMDGVDDQERLGVCMDTCHVFAAGYELRDEKSFKATIREFNRLIGIRKLRAIHLNDSKRELASRVDRHDNIGEGRLGLEPFRLLLADRRFARIPMYLETPKKDNEDGEHWDRVNLRLLRQLAAQRKTA